RRAAPARGAGRGHGDRRRCRHAELRLELLHERRGVHEAHVLQEVLHLLARHFHRIALPSGWNRRLYSTYEAAFPSSAPLPASLGSSAENLTTSFATVTGSSKPRISVSGPSSIGPSFS